ncbi:hypothetical protein [Blastopirellula marina]|uniref:Ketohydroxyglutarate aldolase n=1 Tax=Blastopirellula marina TaxID=124 RepID=A0A2S8GHL1_9BACT|nr:hypothetical protein [Blastopirellula marina]PQO43811.1 hypothetical protein C5Y93_21735 [Blastopirellula marina]
MNPSPKKKSVVITIDDQHKADLKQVAMNCQDLGLEVEYSLETLGQIIGKISVENESKLRNLPGVLGVEDSKDIQLSPPDSEIQ